MCFSIYFIYGHDSTNITHITSSTWEFINSNKTLMNALNARMLFSLYLHISNAGFKNLLQKMLE